MERPGGGGGDFLTPFQTDGRSHPTPAALRGAGGPGLPWGWHASTLLIVVHGGTLQTSPLPFSLPHQGMVLNANDFPLTIGGV